VLTKQIQNESPQLLLSVEFTPSYPSKINN